ncbi:DNA helicase [Salmonella phage 36]|uniref:Uncharacterized protein n=1 Tax=Salmonella phage 36 TaxID=1654889 RepID=A0A0N7CFM1_9CAUD|nr:DNA helicase [Salmonella phage 36]AKJ74061.1 hypothetical protein SP36_89 [Salmonella phage 36]
MFDFDTNKLTPQQVIAIAESQGTSPLRVAIQSNGYRQSSSFWEPVKDINGANDRYPVISLGNDVDVVGKLSRSIAQSVHFLNHRPICISLVAFPPLWLDASKLSITALNNQRRFML